MMPLHQLLLYLILALCLTARVEALEGAEQNSLESETHTIRLYIDQRAQGIEGFGASDAWIIDPMIRKWLAENEQQTIDRLADLLFDTEEGIGLSMWRFNIGAGSAEQGPASRIPDELRRAELLIDVPDGVVDHSKQRGQIMFAQAAADRGVDDMVAFINSPPTWATKNGLAHPGSQSEMTLVGSTNLDPDMLPQFARFQSDVVRYLRDDRGLPIKHLSPINEPTWHWTDQTQEGNRYNNEEVRAVYLATHAALTAAGLSEVVKIDAGESVEYLAALSDQQVREFSGEPYSAGMNNEGLGKYRDYIDLLLGDTELRQVAGEKISLHGYWSDALPERITKLRRLVKAAVAEKSPDARIWMSELCVLGPAAGLRPFGGHGFDVSDMDYALHIARIIHHDLVDLEVTAWMWWLAVTAYDYKDGLLKVDSGLGAESLEASKLMWVVGNFSRFVRPGFRRIPAEVEEQSSPNTMAPAILASSYVSENDSDWVTVVINLSDREQRVQLAPAVFSDPFASLENFGEWDVYLTSKAHNLAPVGVTTEGRVTLPAQSVATLVRGSQLGVSMP